MNYVNYEVSTLQEPEVAGVVVVGEQVVVVVVGEPVVVVVVGGEPVVVVVVGEQVVWAGGVLGHDVPGVWGLAYKIQVALLVATPTQLLSYV